MFPSYLIMVMGFVGPHRTGICPDRQKLSSRGRGRQTVRPFPAGMGRFQTPGRTAPVPARQQRPRPGDHSANSVPVHSIVSFCAGSKPVGCQCRQNHPPDDQPAKERISGSATATFQPTRNPLIGHIGMCGPPQTSISPGSGDLQGPLVTVAVTVKVLVKGGEGVCHSGSKRPHGSAGALASRKLEEIQGSSG
jgi:hypothetical protein